MDVCVPHAECTGVRSKPVPIKVQKIWCKKVLNSLNATLANMRASSDATVVCESCADVRAQRAHLHMTRLIECSERSEHCCKIYCGIAGERSELAC
jgi:hypothetical protein